MDQGTDSQIDLLNERLEAQAQAYEKYSRAFIKILDTLDAVVEDIRNLEKMDGDGRKEVLDKINDLVADLKSHGENAKSIADSFGGRLSEYKDETEKFIEELHLQRHIMESLNPLLQELTKKALSDHASLIDYARKTNALSRTQADLMKAMQSRCQECKADHEAILSKVDRLNATSYFWQASWKTILLYLGAIIGVIGFVWMLSGFGILSVHWLIP